MRYFSKSPKTDRCKHPPLYSSALCAQAWAGPAPQLCSVCRSRWILRVTGQVIRGREGQALDWHAECAGESKGLQRGVSWEAIQARLGSEKKRDRISRKESLLEEGQACEQARRARISLLRDLLETCSRLALPLSLSLSLEW